MTLTFLNSFFILWLSGHSKVGTSVNTSKIKIKQRSHNTRSFSHGHRNHIPLRTNKLKKFTSLDRPYGLKKLTDVRHVRFSKIQFPVWLILKVSMNLEWFRFRFLNLFSFLAWRPRVLLSLTYWLERLRGRRHSDLSHQKGGIQIDILSWNRLYDRMID